MSHASPASPPEVARAISLLVAELNGPLRSSLSALSIATAVVARHDEDLPARAQEALGILTSEVAWHEALWMHLLDSLDRAAGGRRPPPLPSRSSRSASLHSTTHVVVSPPPEIDLATEQWFADVMASACATPADTVLVDFSQVTFCGLAGLNTLLRAADLLRTGGRRLMIRNPPPALWRMAQLTGTAGRLGLELCSSTPRSRIGEHREPDAASSTSHPRRSAGDSEEHREELLPGGR